jgi:hypothetical protein
VQDLNDLQHFAQVVRHGGFSAGRARPASPNRSSANGSLGSSEIYANQHRTRTPLAIGATTLIRNQ